MNRSAEQLLALAPDAASAKAGQSLATARKWRSLRGDEQTAWGLCQGSGKEPYRTQIALSEPAFRCSCPSRPSFACTPDLFPELMAATINRQDISQWAAARDIVTSRADK